VADNSTKHFLETLALAFQASLMHNSHTVFLDREFLVLLHLRIPFE